MTNTLFKKAKAEHIERLEQFVPIVERVHGEANPEFYEVRELFDQLNEKIKIETTQTPVLDEEFTKLRNVTKNYQVPTDVCESYEAVYKMLEELDEAYSKGINPLE